MLVLNRIVMIMATKTNVPAAESSNPRDKTRPNPLGLLLDESAFSLSACNIGLLILFCAFVLERHTLPSDLFPNQTQRFNVLRQALGVVFQDDIGYSAD